MSTKRLTKKAIRENERKEIIYRWMKRTKMTEEQFYQEEFEDGLKWIEERGIPKRLDLSKAFWDWWKLYNEAWQKDLMDAMDKKEFTQEYLRNLVQDYKRICLPKTVIIKIDNELKKTTQNLSLWD